MYIIAIFTYTGVIKIKYLKQNATRVNICSVWKYDSVHFRRTKTASQYERQSILGHISVPHSL